MLVKLINTFVKPYRIQLLIILIAQIVAVAASLSLPMFNALVIDQGVTKGEISKIWQFGLPMLLVAATQIIAQITAVYFSAYTASGFAKDTRYAIFEKVLQFSRQEVSKFGSASLITRNTNDVQQIQQLVYLTCVMMVSAPLTMAGGVIMAFRTDVTLSWTVLAAVVVLGAAVGLMVLRMTPLFQVNQKRLDRVNRVLREQISGVRVIRAFVREPHEAQRFDHANQSLLSLAIRIGAMYSLLFPLAILVMNLSSVAVMWFGGLRVDGGQLQIGMLTAVLTYLMQILISVMMATMMLLIAPRAAVCAQRVMEVLRTESSVQPPKNPVTALTGETTLEFDNVEFSYPGAEQAVLTEISFTLEPGKTTAVIGATGSGKSTLVNLIPRLFDVTGGRVLLNGVDIRDIELNLLWSKIALVPQQAYLFSGTIRSNLRYGCPDTTEPQMWRALEIAQADFVTKLGLDAPITQGGTNLSGGQRQRLSIARALLKQAEINVFDDAFSALDVATEARLRAALATSTKDSAVLIVAQRISSIRHADQIIVLNRGKIEAVGTHQQLLQTSKTYVEIVESQMSLAQA